MGSLTTPSPQAQRLAIQKAFEDAGLLPRQVDFVEPHGTGTVVGDAIEANAAGSVFSEGRNGREVIIGSVKSNIGHGEMGCVMSFLLSFVYLNNILQCIYEFLCKGDHRLHPLLGVGL
jgi:fatty acid synthase, animal type